MSTDRGLTHRRIPTLDVVLLQKPSPSDLPAGSSLPIRSTTQDQVLITALNFMLTQENRRNLYVPDTLDLSFASEVWQRLIHVKCKKRTKLLQRHLGFTPQSSKVEKEGMDHAFLNNASQTSHSVPIKAY